MMSKQQEREVATAALELISGLHGRGFTPGFATAALSLALHWMITNEDQARMICALLESPSLPPDKWFSGMPDFGPTKRSNLQ
jgi:hypothetical protein